MHQGRQAGRGSRILKMRHEYDIKKGHKNVTKNAVKKIFIFLIILHIKYEDKKPHDDRIEKNEIYTEQEEKSYDEEHRYESGQRIGR